jgi:small subunit ribosomal protein S6
MERETVVRKYEATYILDPNLTEEVIGGAVERFKGTVSELGGEIADVKNLGRRRMTIDMKGRSEGVYVSMRFDSSVSAATELKRQMGLSEEVLRCLIVHLN